MISVLLIWIYIILTSFLAGGIAISLYEPVLGYRTQDVRAVILTGLCVVTVYAQFYSLFGGVGLVANILLLVFILTVALILRKRLCGLIINVFAKLKEEKILTLIGIALMFFMAYGSSHGIMHYDTALYHAQAIHWIEDYGVVPGLGNLHCRLGYNSAAFPLTALFSFAWTGSSSFHVCAGFCAWLLSLECLGIVQNFRDRKLSVALFARVMAIYYLMMIFDEMVSPASDYFMVCLAFILVIRWLDNTQADRGDMPTYAMLAYLACVILSIKLSGAVLILTALVPGIKMIKEKLWKSFALSILSGIVIILPYLIRNYVISGWLLYPSTAFNLFTPDWKIPEGTALYDYMEIQVYGRGYTDVTRYHESIVYWFGSWFGERGAIDKLFIMVAIVGVIYFVVKCLYYGFSLCRHPKTTKIPNELFMEAVVSLCFLFWLFTSPLMRYGCLFVYLTDAVIWGTVIVRFGQKKYIQLAVCILLSLFMVYKGAMLTKEIIQGYRSDTWIIQQDYDEYEVGTYQVDSVTVYKPVDGDQTGYDCFPSSPWEMDIELRGDDLSDGFRLKINQIN